MNLKNQTCYHVSFFSLYVKERNGTNVLSVYDMKSVCVKYEECVCVCSREQAVFMSL